MPTIPKPTREKGKRNHPAPFRPRLESLEDRIVPSFADGNGAVITNLVAAGNGSQLVLTFDGPLTAAPANPAQSPTNTANYSVVVPSANAEVVTSSTSTVAIATATYDAVNNQVTLNLASPLTQGTFYRVFVNGVAAADNTANPGLIDGNQLPIDGDYDDTASGNFYALFAWTSGSTALSFKDSGGDQITLGLTGPGQLDAWRQLNGDFNAHWLWPLRPTRLQAAVQQAVNVVGGLLGVDHPGGNCSICNREFGGRRTPHCRARHQLYQHASLVFPANACPPAPCDNANCSDSEQCAIHAGNPTGHRELAPFAIPGFCPRQCDGVRFQRLLVDVRRPHQRLAYFYRDE